MCPTFISTRGGWTWHRLLPGVHEGPGRVKNPLASAVVTAMDLTGGSPADRSVGVLSGDLSLLGGTTDINLARSWWIREAMKGRRNRWVLGNHDFWDASVEESAIKSAKVHEEVRKAYPMGPATPFIMRWSKPTAIRWYLMDSTPIKFFRENLPAKGKIYSGDFRRVVGRIDSTSSATGIVDLQPSRSL